MKSGPLCTHPASYQDELLRRRDYSPGRATPAILVHDVFPSFPIESWNADNSPSLPNVKQLTFARDFQEASTAASLCPFSSAFSRRLRAPSLFHNPQGGVLPYY